MGKTGRNDWVESRALFERPPRELLIFKPRAEDDACPWEFPGGRVAGRESPEACVRRIMHDTFGVRITLLQGQPPFVHNYGTHSITFRYYMVGLAGGDAPHTPTGGELRWVHLQQLREYHFDAPTQQVVDWLMNADSA